MKIQVQSAFYFILFSIILMIAIIDPQNSLGLRYPLLAVFLPIYIYNIFTTFSCFEKKYFVIILSYLLPMWGLIMYLFRGDLNFKLNDTSYISFAILFSIVHILSSDRLIIYFKKASIITGLFFSFLILYNAYELIIIKSNVLTNFVIENEIARVSFRDYEGFELPYVYYYSSTLLILPLSILIEKFSWVRLILILIISTALFLSGTRSHNILSFLFLILFFKKSVSKKIFYIILGIVFFSIAFLYSSNILILLESVFSAKEESNNFKLSMLSKYITMFSDPITIFFGQGFQAVDWNNELRSIVTEKATKTEWTYLELYRVFGFFLPTIIFGYFIYFFFKNASPGDSYKKLILLTLLFDSLLNPHIFSTYGAILMAVVFSTQRSLKVVKMENQY